MDARSVILEPLNIEQRRAVETVQGPLLILAGAGSGKTRTLTHRIAYLIDQGVPPESILAVTFTNRAAREMAERITRLLTMINESQVRPRVPAMGTFHSICARILRRDIQAIGRERDFVIYDSDDQEKLMKEVLKDLKIPIEDMKPRAALAHIGSFKSEAYTVKNVQEQATTQLTERLAEIYERYQKKLRESNALDFDDLILETVRLFREDPKTLERYQHTWQFLNVDEYQDTNHAQYLFVSLLAQAHRNICVIGDPDQSIYAFRGADIRNILEFKNEYKDAVSVTLDQNYRSTQPILDASNAIIRANPGRPAKEMWCDKKTGAPITVEEVDDERLEADHALDRVELLKKTGTSLAQHVVLYRTNAQSRVIEETCLKRGIPYRIIGGLKFYARREVKDVLAYLTVIMNPSDVIALLRIINVPSRKIGETTLLKLRAYGNERQLSLWQTLAHIEMVEGLNEATKARLMNFVTLMESLKKVSKEEPVSALARAVLEATRMEEWVRDGTEEGETRWENIEELLSVTRKYDALAPEVGLQSFLEEVALISEVDALEESNDALTLMTVHLCKGLEFDSVIVVGCEEGVFPHSASFFDRGQLEEERRLMYVAMTRAREHLTLMHTRSRMLFGNVQRNARSRFLDDLPDTNVEYKSDELESAYGWFGGAGKRKKLHGFRQDEMNQDASSLDIDQTPTEELAEGTRVVHGVFGQGTVLSQRGDVVEIAFDDGRVKKIALSIAKIDVL
jgi:DNA helicase-2/ATP-dependent DNA helicase PcrA